MNTYNDNYRNNVLATLNAMEQDLKLIDSANNANMFSLYYAEGATFNAKEQLSAAQKESNIRGETKKAAVTSSNLSNNMLASANQGAQYMKQSVNNTATGAANVQVAANAIVQLAGDLGHILNITRAADYGTEINTQAKNAESYISETAYDAEQASQLAMELTMLTSKVSISTVQASAKAATASISNLLNVMAADYSAISQVVLSENADLATASANEQLALGAYQDSDKEDKAATFAYSKVSTQLNLGLSVTALPHVNESSFKVAFNWLRSPFTEYVPSASVPLSPIPIPPVPVSLEYPFPYPVKNYYLFVAKYQQKDTFTSSDAERIISLGATSNYISVTTDPLLPGFEETYDYKAIALSDTDGVPLTTGNKYVVFLMAEYEETYKRKLNTFENYLSAPSASFYFTDILAAATNFAGADTITDTPQTVSAITFSVTEHSDTISDAMPEYRCIFLPATGISAQNYHEVNAKMKLLNNYAGFKTTYPEFVDLILNLMKTNQAFWSKQVAGVNVLVKKDHTWLANLVVSDANKPYANEVLNKVNSQPVENAEGDANPQATLYSDEVFLKIILTMLLMEAMGFSWDAFKTPVVALEKYKLQLLGFTFNVAIAQSVTAANYTRATPDLPVPGTNENDEDETTGNTGNSPGIASVQPRLVTSGYTASVSLVTTDNFGNEPDPDQFYLPVVLSVADADDNPLSPAYTSSLSYYVPVKIQAPTK